MSIFRRSSSARWLLRIRSTSHCTAAFSPSPVMALTDCQSSAEQREGDGEVSK